MAIFSKKNASLISEIQIESSDTQVHICDLLRKCLIIANKLNLSDFAQWIRCELNGYTGELPTPEYRTIMCSLRLKNPYRGLIPLVIEDKRLENILAKVEVVQSLPSIIALLEETTKGVITFPFSGEQVTRLHQEFDMMEMMPVRIAPASQISGIMDSVRNKILDFALELEKKGITGDGMSFTKEEQEQANKLQNINIDNFQGILGNVSESTVHQSNEIKVVKNDFDSLAKHLNDLGIAFSDVRELEQAVEKDGDISKQNLSGLGENVSGWIGNMVTKASTGSWNVSIAAAGNILGTAICKYYGI